LFLKDYKSPEEQADRDDSGFADSSEVSLHSYVNVPDAACKPAKSALPQYRTPPQIPSQRDVGPINQEPPAKASSPTGNKPNYDEKQANFPC